MILIEKKNSSEDIIFFFLPGYPHIFLKGETSSVQSLWMSLPINIFPKDLTCVFFFIEI